MHRGKNWVCVAVFAYSNYVLLIAAPCNHNTKLFGITKNSRGALFKHTSWSMLEKYRSSSRV